MELSERKHVLHDHLNHTHEELLDVVGQMQPEDWDKPVQSGEGGWTVKELSKATPSAARASRLGVTSRRWPNTPHESGRC